MGKARDQARPGLRIAHYKEELLGLLRSPDDDDPLHLVTGDLSLQSLQDVIRTNIGRSKRATTFVSWLQYFT